MIYLPSSPEIGGPTLVSYLAADPRRRAEFDNITARLGPLGKVENTTRFYVVQSPFRRQVFRRSLAAVHEEIPLWAMEGAHAAGANRQFIDGYDAEVADDGA